jgi:hypothetical protein
MILLARGRARIRCVSARASTTQLGQRPTTRATPLRACFSRRCYGYVWRVASGRRRGLEAGRERVGFGRERRQGGAFRCRRNRSMVGIGRQKLSQLRVRSRVAPLRRSHCHYGPSFAPDRLSHGALRPLLPSAGMDHRQQRFLLRKPDPHPPQNRPDPHLDRLASHSGPPEEDRIACRDHIRRNDLVVPVAYRSPNAGEARLVALMRSLL